ncbi:MAG: type III-A CRISPR-associated RAMP protein Csm3 [Candidatus Methanoperedens sp.]|nr:type III-A CRISPR-associated RAMP protein Csm3 [Candidatus Methanoperedens sp.]MCZ7405294.1 type III-A CRISPR-associated RAMP protein Csm3 [Candidatus Methanoperedens sp.]
MLLGKVIIKGEMELKTGMHVGASKETMKIGGIDSPVVRDPTTDFPYIPGSSLKGKMRSLWERANAKDKRFFNVDNDGINRHECKLVEPENEDKTKYQFKKIEEIEMCPVCRIFGSAKGNFPSRIIVRDLHLTKKSEEDLKKIDTGLKYTEWKFENVIDRITAQASPRQIERVPAGSVFKLEIIYNMENKENAESDLRNIEKCLELLKDDYLGGQGSRGYGKIECSQLTTTVKKIEYYLKGEKNSIKECTDLKGAIEFIKA